jgi:hypothetical protein
MSLFSAVLGAGTNSAMSGKLGGLNMDVAKKSVSGFMESSGDALVKVADVVGILPKQDQMLEYLGEQATAHGVAAECEALVNDPILFGTVWKALNDHDWEEFCVDDNETLDISGYQRVMDLSRTEKQFERAIQAAAEQTFPKLYLLRCVALGVTFTDEGWLTRAKVNTFRTFFLRLALPGNEYDKYIDWYVIITSEKDAWDEMRSGQNSKFGFLIDSVSNVVSTKAGSFLEDKFSDLIAEKWREYTA